MTDEAKKLLRAWMNSAEHAMQTPRSTDWQHMIQATADFLSRPEPAAPEPNKLMSDHEADARPRGESDHSAIAGTIASADATIGARPAEVTSVPRQADPVGQTPQAQSDALDAARYRWLRDGGWSNPALYSTFGARDQSYLHGGRKLGEIIDAAIAKAKERKE